MRIDYSTTDLLAYINWVYFYHAWGVPPQSDDAARLRAEAEKLLAALRPYVVARCVVELFPAYSEGDDIVVSRTYKCECGQCHPTGETERLPMLRQQTPDSSGFCLCLSDFVRPKDDKIGVFATSVAMRKSRFANKGNADNDELLDKVENIDNLSTLENNDTLENIDALMLQTLHDRLAEAAAERLHEEVRKRIWGYAPDERLTIEEMHREVFQGIRPAVGYPCLPDMSLNFVIGKLLDFNSIGVVLTDHGMMQPHASVSGLMISHTKSRYFSVGRIDNTQLADYAARRGVSADEMRKYLAANIQN